MAYNQDDMNEIRELLIGHKVTRISEDRLQLDDGRVLQFIGNDGGCACDAGCYPLTELNGVDNVITSVEFANNPGGDDTATYDGTYQIFVYADNTRINLATFRGTDGNGYYGTGYVIQIIDKDCA